MSYTSFKTFTLAVSLFLIAGCAAAPSTEPAAPKPPQNLLGTTDELQLVTELSIDLGTRHGIDHVLVVLEIDNTLLTTTAQDPCNSINLNVATVQPDTPSQVQRMQDAGLKVIAISSRGPGCSQQTLAGLDQTGINFQASAWPLQSGLPEQFVPEGAVDPVSYQQGVLFASGQDQGLMLKALIEYSGSPYPMLIIMADHDQNNLSSVMKAFSWTGTKVHAWRYTRLDTNTVAD